MMSRHCVRTYQGNKLTSNLSGKTYPQSSQLAEPLWIDRGLKSGIDVHVLISTSGVGGGGGAGRERFI